MPPGGKLGIRDRERLALALFAPTSRYLTAVARRGGQDIALSEIHADLRSDEWYDIAVGKRGARPGRAAGHHGRQAVRQRSWTSSAAPMPAGPSRSAAFFEAAEKAHGKPLGDLKDAWLNGDALAEARVPTHALARPRAGSGRSIRSSGSSTRR